MIPFGQALQDTGSAQLIADGVVALAGTLPALAPLGIVLVATMAATPVLNNAATVVIMAPIALAIAQRTELNADPFLIAVAVRSEEHTSELQSLMRTSYAVFCLKKK